MVYLKKTQKFFIELIIGSFFVPVATVCYTKFMIDSINTYLQNELPIIPLRTNSKIPIFNGWQTVSIADQWAKVRGSHNVGLRMGNGLMCIDGDNPATVDWLADTLAHLNPVTVRSASDNRHFYLRTDTDTLIERYDRQYKKISHPEYAGEFRFGAGSQTVMPPSTVANGAYTLLTGDFNAIPTVPVSLIELLINATTKPQPKKVHPKKARVIQTNTNYTTLTVPLKKRDIDQYTLQRLTWLSTATEGESFTYEYLDKSYTYKSRSEVEFSVVRRLILKGHTDIEAILIEYDAGHYVEHHNPSHYFTKLHVRCIEYIVRSPRINDLQNMYHHDFDIKPRTKLILKALISFGVQFNIMQPSITKLELSRLTGIVNFKTITDSLNELTLLGVIPILSKNEQYLKYNLMKLKDIVDKTSPTCTNKYAITTKSLNEALTTAYTLGGTRLKMITELKSGDMSIKQMSIKLDISTSNLYQMVKMLVDKGIVIKNGMTYKLLIVDLVTVLDIKVKIKVNLIKIQVRLDAWAAYVEANRLTEDARRWLSTLRSFVKAKNYRIAMT